MTRFITLSILFSLLTASATIAQTSYTTGVIRGNSSDNTKLVAAEFDNYGDHILAGKFFDSVQVNAFSGNLTLLGGNSSTGVHNSFFAKYDSYGFAYFAKKLGNATDSVTITAASMDNMGNILIGGTFVGTVDFADNAGNPITRTANGQDAFIAYYDFNGNLNYVSVFDFNSTIGKITDIRVANSSYNVLATGYFNGTIDTDPSAGTNNLTATAVDGFLLKLDGALDLITAYQYGGAGNQKPKQLFMDWENPIVAGDFTTQIDVDIEASTVIKNSNGGSDFFIAYYDYTDSLIYELTVGGTGNDNIKDFMYSPSTGYYVLADFTNTVDFNPNGGPISLTTNGNTDVAFARYDYTLNLGYVKKFGSTAADKGTTILKNESTGGRSQYADDDIILALNFGSTIDLDPDGGGVMATPTNTTSNSAIINLDSSGYYLMHGVIEAQEILGYKGTGFNGNDMIMAGNFSGTNVDMLPFADVSTLSHSGINSIFHVKYNRCNLQIGEPYIKDIFECGSYDVHLGIEVLSGGIGPFEFNWSNGDYYSYEQYPTDAYQDNSNYFNINVTDHYGCGTGDTLWVYAHDSQTPFTATINVTNTSCGNDFGSAQAVGNNALGTISYYWSDGETDDTADSLLAGNYFVQVIDDSLKCYVTNTFFVSNSDGPQISIVSAADATCGDVDNGSIDVSVTGGATPYTFHWTNGATTEDISGLSGGTYTLNVIDANGCENMICVTLTQPGEIQSGHNFFSSTCNTSDGTIMVSAWGSYTPYTFQWDAAAGNSTNDTVYNLPAGIYSVTITDSLGCSKSFNYGISDWNGPMAYINWTSNPDCIGGTGYIDAYTYDWNGSGILNYYWAETGETTEDIGVSNGGYYNLLVTDGFNCKGYTNAWVYDVLPMSPTICMVTVDSTATKNVVVWDKSTTQEASYYNIYREGFCNSNDFGIVGAVDFDSLSVFYDTVVNSDTRTWRYYVTAVDTCGNESSPSEIHRTIHLTAAVDADTNIFLDWSEYQGMQILGYKVYRKQASGNLFDYVDSVDAFQTHYLDTISFIGYSEVEYFVDAIPASVCNATRAYNQNEARSNHSRAGLPAPDTSTISTPELITETSINLYPNPTNDIVNLMVNGSKANWNMEMTDQTGRIVMQGTIREQAAFSTKNIPAGVYFIRLSSDKNETHTMKLMVIR